MKKEDVIAFLGIIGTLITIVYGIWWASIGADRSNYEFCKKEYISNVSTGNGTNFSEMFKYCYDEVY